MSLARAANASDRRQRGVALVIVMGVVATAGVMVAHLAMTTEVLAREAVVASERQRLRYVAESAAGRAAWMYMTDRRLFTDRSLGGVPAARETSDLEPWMLDGREHRDEEAGWTVRLGDALAGIDFSGRNPGEELRVQGAAAPDESEESEEQEIIDEFLDIVKDYIDTDDLVRLRGMERSNYEDAEMLGLPRDAPFHYREEVYWLPGWSEVVFGRVRLIAPRGIGQGSRRRRERKPPFFSASPGMLREKGRLEDDELERVLAARRQWQTSGEPLEESLDALLVGRLKSSFSFVESGLATIEAVAHSFDGQVSRTVRLTMNCDIGRAEAYSDKERNTWAVWESRVE
ncbi:MAG: hypothetical protein KAI66_00920 [Lentisphaeria bacterium]|nr:hypothetical protein [Lentisphaeria bacterium]